MREIKCKAFRKDSREIGEVLSIDIENGIAKIEFYTKENEYYHIVCELIDENIVIRWYTGLKDKNGTEIYEGDIVKSNKSKYKRFDDDGIYEVYFNEFLCHYALIASRNEWEQKHGQYDNYALTGAKEKDFEVIGNIYENTSLLEGRD